MSTPRRSSSSREPLRYRPHDGSPPRPAGPPRDRVRPQAAELAKVKQEAGAAKLDTLLLDVTSNASIEAAVLEVDRLTGGRGLDVLVNNAGFGVLGPTSEITESEMRRQYETNVFGLMNVTRAFLRRCASAARAASSTCRASVAASRCRSSASTTRRSTRSRACRRRCATSCVRSHRRRPHRTGRHPHELRGDRGLEPRLVRVDPYAVAVEKYEQMSKFADSSRRTEHRRELPSLGPHFRGYGTLDCARVQGDFSDYDFLGGMRRLDLTARASKIGVGSPLRISDGASARAMCVRIRSATR